MRRAADLLTAGLVGMAVYQLVLALGAPLGHAAWGGAHAELTGAQRVGSAVSVALYVVAIVVVRGQAAGSTRSFYRWGMWILASIMALAAVANVVSASDWERFLLAPVALILFALCVVVARGGRRGSLRG